MKKIAAAIASIGTFLSLTTVAFASDVAISPPKNVRITNIGELLSAIIGILLIVAVLIALFYLILGGIQWITSGGDKAAVEAAQKKIQAALIGIVIVFAIFAIFNLVGRFLGFDVFNFDLPKPFK